MDRQTLIGGAVTILVVGAVVGVGLRGVLAPPKTRDEVKKEAPKTGTSTTATPNEPHAKSAKTPKRDCTLAILKSGDVFVHLDARRPGVDVPLELAGQAHLVLEYGYDMPRPIPDLDVGERGIHATLSFHGTPKPTFVPWSAVFAVVDEDKHGCVYETDAPPEASGDHH